MGLLDPPAISPVNFAKLATKEGQDGLYNTTIQHHFTRRRSNYFTITDVNLSAITTTGGTSTAQAGFGPMIDLTDYSEAIVSVWGNSITSLGTGGTTVTLAVQLFDYRNTIFFPMPSSVINPGPITPQTGTNVIQSYTMTNFGSLVRFGFVCAGVFTGAVGTISVQLLVKG